MVLGALAVVLCAAAPAAQAARSEFFGIAQGALDAPDAQQMSDVGVRTERFQIKWREMEPTKGSYDWFARDWLVGALASRGIRPAPFVWGSPQWVGNGAAARPPLDNAADIQAWQSFLRAAVSRYGPGGTYWANGYRQRFGDDAIPLPIQSWQIWNEPNLKKFFAPGTTVQQSAQKYARLLSVSRDAIKGRDPQARIVNAGMPGYGDVTAWKFLNNLYQVSGFKDDMDIAALHPFAPNLDELRREIDSFRAVMVNRNDRPTPLWLTELAWGSGEPDQFGLNKGLAGQNQLLRDAYRLILSRRSDWNIQRLFWFLWHDPPPGSFYATLCSICGTAGLVDHTRTPKPAYDTFRGFTAETTPPVARITGGPANGGLTKNRTPSFQFDSNEPGSTFVCRVDTGLNKTCASPYTLPALSDAAHTFYVRAVDAPGNESAFVSRSFTVDSHAPVAPRINDTDPNSPANDNLPEVKGQAETGSTVRLYKSAGCTGVMLASGPAAQFRIPGITASVPNNTMTTFRARAVDAAGNLSPCSAARAYIEDSAAPAAPRINDTDPNSPANNNAPTVKGFSTAGSTVALYTTAGCTGTPVASGSSAQFASPGLAASVADNTTTLFRAKASDSRRQPLGVLDRAPVRRGFAGARTAADHGYRPQLAGQQQRPQGEGHGPGRLERAPVQGVQLHGRSAGHRLRRHVRLAGPHRFRRRQHHELVPRQGDRPRRQRLGVLGQLQVRRELKPGADGDGRRVERVGLDLRGLRQLPLRVRIRQAAATSWPYVLPINTTP